MIEERALEHNAPALCAVGLRPTVRRYRGRIMCVHVQCPPRKEALRGCRCAGALIAIIDGNNSGPQAAFTPINLSVFQPTAVVRCWPFERSTVLAASRACGEWPKTATLDSGCARCREGLANSTRREWLTQTRRNPHAALRSHP